MKGLYKGTFRKLLAAMTALGLTLTGTLPASASGQTEQISSTEAEASGASTEAGQASGEETSGETEAGQTAGDSTEAEEAAGEAASGEKDPDSGASARKEETVYIFTDANGNQKSMLVSDWLKNLDKAGSIEDVSDLTDIENVKGDETYTQDGDKVTWQADGKDIYYQGNTDKEAPVGVKITYTLDGKEVSPEELAGASGHLKIHFEYTNNETREEETDGKKISVKVPFGVMSGLLMTDGCAENVTVSTGKVIEEGDSIAVVGLAFPGLRDSLKLSEIGRAHV